MHLNKVHHIAIICSDYERSKRFYTEVYTHKRFLFFSDPDGLPIELIDSANM